MGNGAEGEYKTGLAAESNSLLLRTLNKYYHSKT